MTTAITLSQRRREVEYVLSGYQPANVHLDRAIHLALTHEWNVEPSPSGEFLARCATRTIEIAHRLTSDEDFASFCHEGGHLEDPRASSRPLTQHEVRPGREISIPGECFAWLFSMRAAGWRWNIHMQREMERCLAGYAAFNDHVTDLNTILATVAYGAELAKQVVRVKPLPIPASIADLVSDINSVSLERRSL